MFLRPANMWPRFRGAKRAAGLIEFQFLITADHAELKVHVKRVKSALLYLACVFILRRLILRNIFVLVN